MSGIDILVGGHTNTFLWSGRRPAYLKHIPDGPYPTVVDGSENKVLVVQTNGYGRYLGKLHVTFDENGNPSEWHGNPLLLNGSYPKDESLQAKVEDYRAKVAAKMDTVVSSTFF